MRRFESCRGYQLRNPHILQGEGVENRSFVVANVDPPHEGRQDPPLGLGVLTFQRRPQILKDGSDHFGTDRDSVVIPLPLQVLKAGFESHLLTLSLGQAVSDGFSRFYRKI